MSSASNMRQALVTMAIGGFSLLTFSPGAAAANTLPDAAPVTAKMEALPRNAPAGTSIELAITMEIAAPYHIYAPGEPPHRSIPMSVTLDLPRGFTLGKDWSFPAPISTASGDLIYVGNLVIRCIVKVPRDSAADVLTLKGKVSFQACNEEACWPPESLPLSTTINLKPAAP